MLAARWFLDVTQPTASLCLCGENLRRGFWSAVLQHRFRFGPSGIEWLWHIWNCAPEGRAPLQIRSCGADPRRRETAPSTFHLRVLLRQNPISGRAGSHLPAASRINSVLLAPTGQRLVAALVREQTTGFKPKDRVCTDPHRRAVDCAHYLTLYASAVKDLRRSFWSAVLQHRFRFH